MTTALRRLEWGDLVQQEMGHHLTAMEIEHILWEETAFPFASEGVVRRQVREYRDRSASWRA